MDDTDRSATANREGPEHGSTVPNLDAPIGAAQAIAMLRAEGYGDGIELTADGVWCASCARIHAADGLVQERMFRFEGPSNPDDLSIVVGIRCRACGESGIVVSAYGPLADPRLFDILNRIPIDHDASDPAAGAEP